MPNWMKSKFFWLNLIAVLALVVQQVIDKNLLPQWGTLEGIVLVVLNAVAGILQGQQVYQLKKSVKYFKSQVHKQ